MKVLIRYDVPVYAEVVLDEDGDVEFDRMGKVVIDDENLSDIKQYEDENGEPADLDADTLKRVHDALGGEWPGWEFGW